jgi:membrane protease YdiL (CAAX protease family)
MTSFDARVSPGDLFTRKHPTTRWGRVVQFPLARMPVVVLFLVPVALGHNLVVIFGIERLAMPWSAVALDLLVPLELLCFILLYRLYARCVEGRAAHEMSVRGAAREAAAGVGLAGILVGATFVVLLATGSYRLVGTNGVWSLARGLGTFPTGAFIQVLLFRLILFRLTEEWVGTWIAFALTAGLFSLAHVWNAHMTLAGFFGLLSGDVLLFAAFALTRRVWLVWGFHTGWNFFQDGILGMPNSGITSLPSFLEAEVSGPTWLTGGAVGIEASVLTALLTVLCGLWMIRRLVRDGQTVAPSWSVSRPRSRVHRPE